MSEPSNNFERMIQLAGEVFDAHHDPEQLDVDEAVIAKLQQLHPATVSEYVEGDGPVVWVLLIPTTTTLMNRFVAGEIPENALLDKTLPGALYDALYLCSALVLPEHRRKGIAKKLTLDAIKRIRADHPIRAIFTWSFSREGELLAEATAVHEGLPLLKRPR